MITVPIACLGLTLLGFFFIEIESSSPGAPVIFLPGYSGSTLYANITNAKFIPRTCDGIVPVGEFFSVIYNASLLALSPKCIYDLMSTSFDEESNQFLSTKGIVVSVQNFGGFSGLSPVYLSFARQLESWGYTLGQNAFGAPYDYRFMSKEMLSAVGFVSDIKNLIEKACNLNNGSPVVLIGHSNGGPTLYNFLDSMEAEWRKTHVAALIGLSGNFLGQMNGIKPFVDPDETGEKEMMNSWEAQYMSFTAGDYNAIDKTTIIVTYSGDSERERKYSPKKADIVSLFEATGRFDWLSRYEAAQDRMHRSTHPGVDTYCFYGSNVSTSYGFVFEGEVLEKAHTTVLTMDGDGNQDIIDNQMCEIWKLALKENNLPLAARTARGLKTHAAGEVEEQRGLQQSRSRGEKNLEEGRNMDATWVTETKAFPGVRHMEMYTDKAVLANVLNVLQRYK